MKPQDKLTLTVQCKPTASNSRIAAIIVEADPSLKKTCFLETSTITDGANIDARFSYLDNPDSIVNISGTMSVNDGVLEVSSQRFALLIPGLADAVKPVLRIIKNDNGSGSTVLT